MGLRVRRVGLQRWRARTVLGGHDVGVARLWQGGPVGGGEGAYQHHLNLPLDQRDGDARGASGDVRRYRPGANQHHQLHLLVVVVPLGAAADDRWLLPPSCFFRLHLFVAFDGMLCTGVGDENGRRVCVCVRATLLLQPDFGVFLWWMWLVLRGMQVQVTRNTDF